MIYIDHEINLAIIAEIKLNTTNIDKFNLIYFSQFCIEVQYCFDKFNIISNALNKLSMKFSIKNKISNLNIDAKKSKIDQMYAYVTRVTAGLGFGQKNPTLKHSRVGSDTYNCPTNRVGQS